MSVNLEGAFNMALAIQEKDMEYYQVSTDTTITIKVAPSNYYRNHEMLEEMVSEGREFVISRQTFEESFTGQPVRGDRLIAANTGNYTVREIREMQVLGSIVGYRLRCD